MTLATFDSSELDFLASRYRRSLAAVMMRLQQVQRSIDKLESARLGPDGQLVHNPLSEFEKPSDIVKDLDLSVTDNKKALETLELNAHQLITASNEGMAPLKDHVREHEPQLDEVVKAKSHIGERPNYKPTQ